MRSLIKLHTLLEKFFGPLPQLDVVVIGKLRGRWVFGLIGLSPIYLPLFWLLPPTENTLADRAL